MKRLLKISFDLMLFSFIPVFSWFILSLIIDRRLMNVFTITYPLQYLVLILKSVFSTGANIAEKKDNDNNMSNSGIFFGVIFTVIIFGYLSLNVDSYISFMNMDSSIYHLFTLYSILQIGIQLLLNLIISKLHYKEKNSLGNGYSLVFNLINFISIIVCSIIFENKLIAIIITIFLITLYTLVIYIKTFEKFKIRWNIYRFIKYDSVEFVNNISYLLIYLFGFSNALNFGPKYAMALTFVSLITDTQWDVFEAIAVDTNINISKKCFNLKKQLLKAYKLLTILLFSVFVLFMILYFFYDLNITIVLIYLGCELFNFLLFPIYRIEICYLQIEYSSFKTMLNKLATNMIRIGSSFLHTPFCTGIGQVISTIYQLITVSLMMHRNFRIEVDGTVTKRIKK